MAKKKKRINIKLIVIITSIIAIMVVGIGGVYISKKYADPQSHFDEAELLCEEANALEIALNEEVSGISDRGERYTALEDALRAEDGPYKLRKEAIGELGGVFSLRSASYEQKLDSGLRQAEIALECQDYKTAVGVWEKLGQMFSDAVEPRKLLLDYYIVVGRHNIGASSLWDRVLEHANLLIEIDVDDLSGHLGAIEAKIALIHIGASENVDILSEEIDTALAYVSSIEKSYRWYQLSGKYNNVKARTSEFEEDKNRFFKLASDFYKEGFKQFSDQVDTYDNIWEEWYLPNYTRQVQYFATPSLSAADRDIGFEALEVLKVEINEFISEGIKKFPNEGLLYFIKGKFQYLQLNSSGLGKPDMILAEDAYDDIIQSFEKAIALDNDKGLWQFVKSQALFEKSQMLADGSKELLASYEGLKSAIYKTDLLLIDKHPKHSQVWNIRFGQLYYNLVHHATVLASDADNEIEKAAFMAVAEENATILTEQFGEEHHLSQACMGYVAFAKGDMVKAETMLYRSYVNSKDNPAPQMMYKLAQAVNHHKNIVLALRFHDMVMQSHLYYKTSKHFLEAVDILASSKTLEMKRYLVLIITKNKGLFKFDEATEQRLLLLKANALVSLRQLEKFDEIASKLTGDDVEVRYIKAVSLSNVEERIASIEALLKDYPAHEKSLQIVRMYYIKKENIDSHTTTKLKTLFDKAKALAPENSFIVYCAKRFSLDEWQSLSLIDDIHMQIEAVKSVKDLDSQNIAVGDLYQLLSTQSEINDEEKMNALLMAKTSYEKAENDQYGNELAMKLATLNLALDDLQALETLIADALESEDIVQANLLQAVRAISNNEYAKAVEHYRIVVKERPLLISAHVSLAKSLILDNQADEAISIINVLISHENKNIPLMINHIEANRMKAILLDQAYSQNDYKAIDYQEASSIVQCLNRIIIADPTNFQGLRLTVKYSPVIMQRTYEATRSSSNINQANSTITALFKRGYISGKALIQIDPTQGVFYAMLANVYTVYANLKDLNPKSELERQRVAEAHESAEKVFKTGLRNHPDNTTIGAAYSQYLADADRDDEAIKIMETIAGKSSGVDRVESLASLARAYRIQGAYLHAVKTLDEALLLAPDNLQLLMIKCETLGLLKKYTEAIEVVQHIRGIEDKPLYIAKEIELLLQNSLGKSPDVAKTFVTEAQKVYEAQVKVHPDKTVLDLIGAKVMIYNHAFEDARALAQLVIDKTADNVRAHHNAYILVAEAYHFEGNLKAAIETMENLRSVVGRNSDAGINELARYYDVAGRTSDAIFQMKEMIRISPKDVGARLGLIRAYEESLAWEDAVTHYKVLLNQYPKAANFYIKAAYAKAYHGQQLKDKKMISKSKLLFKESMEWVGVARGILKENNQSTEEADDVYLHIENIQEQYAQVIKHIDELYPDGKTSLSVKLLRSVSLYHLGKKVEAFKEFDKALASAGNDVAQRDRVMAYIERVGSKDDVIAWLDKKITKMPKWLTLYKILIGVHKKNNDAAKVVEVLKQALVYVADEQGRLDIHYELGLYTGSLGRYEESISHYKDVLAKNNSHAQSLNNLAYTYMLLGGHKAEAEEMAALAYSQEEDNADYIDTYVMTLIETEKFEQAEPLILKAIDIKRENREFVDVDREYVAPEFYYHLGQVLEGLSEHERARIQFEIAVKLIIKMKTKRKDYIDMKKAIESKLNV